ncbi:MAG: PTS sugar transporter subunit IIC [Gemmatimonadota bacterium]
MSPATVALLLAWGTLVGIDLVSAPQAMLARPIVAGTVAGLIVGDLEAGLRVGALLELFALDVLPIGAVRYPDFGPGTVAAVALAAGTPWAQSLGLAMLLGLPLAALGGWTHPVLRRANGAAIARLAERMSAGDAAAIARVQWGGILRDGLRSLGLTALGLAAGWVIEDSVRLDPATARVLAYVAVGGGLASVLHGAVRSAGHTRRRAWLGLGIGVGLLVSLVA